MAGELLRGMARTAVIAGTAQATANAVNRRQARRNIQAYSDAGAQVVAPPPGAPAMQMPSVESMDDKLSQLERLGQLKAQGILSEEEFIKQKAAILGQ